MTSAELNTLFGLTGLVIATATFFVGLYIGKRRRLTDQSAQRMDGVVRTYQDLFLPRTDGGMSALLKAGITSVKDNSEARAVIQKLTKINGLNPLSPHDDKLDKVNLLSFFERLRDSGHNPHSDNAVNKVLAAMEAKRDVGRREL